MVVCLPKAQTRATNTVADSWLIGGHERLGVELRCEMQINLLCWAASNAKLSVANDRVKCVVHVLEIRHVNATVDVLQSVRNVDVCVS